MPAFQKPQLGSVKAKILLVGSFGSGKTYGGLTFPRPAVIDSEGSVDLYGNEFEFVSVPTKSLKEALGAINEVMRGKVEVAGKPCDTLVIDSLSSFYDGVQHAMMRPDGSIDMQAWGLIKRKYAEFIDTLYHKTDVHVVATARVKPKFSADKTDKKTGELLQDGEIIDCDKKVPYAFDLVFWLSIDANGKRTAKVMKSRGIFSKELPQGKVIDGGFSWSVVEAVLNKHKTGPARNTGKISEEVLEQDAAMLNPVNHTDALRAAYEALIAWKPETSKKEAAEEMLRTIAIEMEIAEKEKLADLTPGQLTWLAEHFTKMREEAVKA